MGFLNALRGQITKPASPVAAPGAKPFGGMLGQAAMPQAAGAPQLTPDQARPFAGAAAPAAPTGTLSSLIGGAQPVAQPMANTNVKTLTPAPTVGPFGGRMGSPLGVSNPMPTSAANPRPTGFMRRFGRR